MSIIVTDNQPALENKFLITTATATKFINILQYNQPQIVSIVTVY